MTSECRSEACSCLSVIPSGPSAWEHSTLSTSSLVIGAMIPTNSGSTVAGPEQGGAEGCVIISAQKSTKALGSRILDSQAPSSNSFTYLDLCFR